jgi:hypothetical protein
MANVDVSKVEWNKNEKALLNVMRRTKGPIHLKTMAARAFLKNKKMGKVKANSWARNSLRRFIRLHLVKQVDRGTYEFIGTKGKKIAAKKATAAKSQKAKTEAKAKVETKAKTETAVKTKKTAAPKAPKAETVTPAPAAQPQPETQDSRPGHIVPKDL